MERNLRKERVGIVTSNKMDKSIVVSVETKVMHPKYGKFVKQTKRFMAHDEKSPRCRNTPRKVRTQMGKVVGNSHPEQSAGPVQQKVNRQ